MVAAAPWVLMLTISLAIYFAAKVATLLTQRHHWNVRALAYLFAWPGMDAAAFLDRARRPQPVTAGDWWRGGAYAILGASVIWFLVPRLMSASPLLAGWAGFLGIVLLLHFGLLDLSSSVWRSVGIDAAPIMRWPLASVSLAEFWGRRWNRAFRDLAYPWLFKPLTRWLGPCGGILGGNMAAFGASGVVHELAISFPARAGFGGPTAYFLLQGAALLFEHSGMGRALGLGKGRCGWAFTMLVVLAPFPLLVHPSFVRTVMLPLLAAIGADEARSLSMNAITTLILLGGVLHLGILIASATIPSLLDWRTELRSLQPLTRQLIWVHGGYIVGTIIAFGLVSLLMAPLLASGEPLARAVCGFIALFWLVRIVVEFLVFDRKPITATPRLRWGERALVSVFACLVAVYGWAAVGV